MTFLSALDAYIEDCGVFDTIEAMRFETFNPADMEPLGKGADKDVFVDPENRERTISVIKAKEGIEQDSPNRLKGAFYLTKIAHLLIPDHVPDIYQAGESSDGKLSFDRERISHTPGHERLQAARHSGDDSKEATEMMMAEMGAKPSDVDMQLGNIGLGFNIDSNFGNYTQDEKGNVYYLETFMPWEADDLDQNKLEPLFDEAQLREAIDKLSSPETKKTCLAYLDRLLALLGEERARIESIGRAVVGEADTDVRAFEESITDFEAKRDVGALLAIKTMDEALKSEERSSAKIALSDIRKKLKALEDGRKLTSEHYSDLDAKYRRLSRAVGMINSGIVDHER